MKLFHTRFYTDPAFLSLAVHSGFVRMQLLPLREGGWRLHVGLPHGLSDADLEAYVKQH